MKAIILKSFGDHDNFALEEVEDPILKNNEVLVRIMATSFNPIDYQIRHGLAESKLLSSPILGREMSGIIVDVGQDVLNFSIGDEVVSYVGSLGSNGTFAELIAIPLGLFIRKPPSLSFEGATSIPMVGLTALQCFKKIQIQKDNSIFISGGAGGVGAFLIQLLLLNGFNKIITTAGNEESKKHLMQLGIPEKNILNYKENNFLNSILEVNNQFLFDSCVDLVGGEFSTICSSILKPHGIYGNVTNNISNKAYEDLFDKGITIVNVSNYAYALNSKPEEFNYYSKELKYIMSLTNNRKIYQPPLFVFQGLSVKNVDEAFNLMENNQAKGRKIVMTIEPIVLEKKHS